MTDSRSLAVSALLLLVFMAIGALSHPQLHPLSPAELEEGMPGVLETRAEQVDYFARRGMKVMTPQDSTACQLNFPDLCDSVVAMTPQIQLIVNTALTLFSGQTYSNLSDFVDMFGSRLAGTSNLEAAINSLEASLKSSGATNMQSENVTVPAWSRGTEIATLMTPRKLNLALFGLGNSVNTPLLGITADVVVFNSFLEIQLANPSSISGKIAVCNFGGLISPLDTTATGYSILATAGAVATLYRSAATFSLYSPHARRSSLYYDGVSPRVPIAYLTFEDCDFLSREAKRGLKLSIHLSMLNNNVDGTAQSRNVFGDLAGSANNGEFVIFSGHTDSWDVGQGAQDDGVGVMLAIKALQLLKSLNLTPKRAIRVALWTGEEHAYAGSTQYIKDNRPDVDNKLSVALEADYGCLTSAGLTFNGLPELGCIAEQIVLLAGPLASNQLVVPSPSMKTDLDNFSAINVPTVSLNGDDGRYFWFHHTNADTMTAVNSTQLDRCLALWASTAYVLANLPNKINRVPLVTLPTLPPIIG